MPTISKKRLVDVVKRHATRCFFVDDQDFRYERHAVAKSVFKAEVERRTEYDLECTLKFCGYDVELRQLDEVHIDNPQQRKALKTFINEKLAEANLWLPCQLDFVESLWVDKASLIMEGWTGKDAEAIMADLIEVGALERLSDQGPIVLKPAAWRTAQRQKWDLDQ